MNDSQRDDEISKKERQDIEECFMLGRLADDGSLPRLGAELDKSVAYHKDGDDRVEIGRAHV